MMVRQAGLLNKLLIVVGVVSALCVSCGLKTTKDEVVRQNPESSIRKVAPQGAVEQPTMLSTLTVAKVNIEIVDADQISSNVNNGSVTIGFNMTGQGSGAFTLLCRAGTIPDVWRLRYHVCNSGGNAETMSNLQSGVAYGIGVVAMSGDDGSISREVSAPFTVSAK